MSRRARVFTLWALGNIAAATWLYWSGAVGYFISYERLIVGLLFGMLAVGLSAGLLGWLEKLSRHG